MDVLATRSEAQTLLSKNRWDDTAAAALPALDCLVYRSQLLGQDRTIMNMYGGNTSVKRLETDHMGREVEVLWVKGSGSDVATITEQGFAGLRMADMLPLLGRAAMSDEDMIAYLANATHALNRPRQSIETLLHAFTPARHVDHTHPDAVISLACASNGRALCEELWGERMVWVDFIRPGFTLSKWIGAGIRSNPHAELVVMGKHGLVTWGDDSHATYDRTIAVIQEAEAFIQQKRGERAIFASAVPQLGQDTRRAALLAVLPVLRGALSVARPAVLKVDSSQAVLDFVGSAGAAELSQVGAACPDHLVHTKMQPLFVAWAPEQGVDALVAGLPGEVAAYAERYRAYFAQHHAEGDLIGDPYPRIVLIPGLGMISAGIDATGAAVSGQLYLRAIRVMEGSMALGSFTSLSAAESYSIEYWPLELYKLRLKPAPRELSGNIAVITGGASGIGRATARRLAQDGAHIAILDINSVGAQMLADELNTQHGAGRAIAISCNVTSEAAVERAFEEAILSFGGADIVVSNAGIAISAPIDQTSLADYEKTFDILTKGYFLVSRAAFALWKRQGLGGSLIYVASKNSVAAGKNAAVYSAAKAAELHMARCLADEGGAHSIRVNSVLPDAVLAGSSIWDAGWRQARAASYGIQPAELDEFYRQRTVLKVNVLPEHIAEAISFLAGPRASRTTGGALTVDGGVAIAYLR